MNLNWYAIIENVITTVLIGGIVWRLEKLRQKVYNTRTKTLDQDQQDPLN